MNKLIGFLIIIGGLSGGYMLYQDYAAKEKERRNPAADEIRRVIAETLKPQNLSNTEDPWYASEAALFRILAYLNTAEQEKYSVGETINAAVSESGARPGVGKIIGSMLEENYALAKRLGIFNELGNVMKMRDGLNPTAKAKGWEDERIVAGHLLSPTIAPEAARSLANLVLMPASVRDMQSDDLSGFTSEQSKKWLAERIIEPASHKIVEERLNPKNKALY